MPHLKSFYLQLQKHQLYFLETLQLCGFLFVWLFQEGSWLKHNLTLHISFMANHYSRTNYHPGSSKALTELLYLVFQYSVPIFNNENKTDYCLLHVTGMMK